MSFLSSFKIFTGMLFGPDDLCESREDIKDISLSIGAKKKVFVFIGSLCNVLVKAKSPPPLKCVTDILQR